MFLRLVEGGHQKKDSRLNSSQKFKDRGSYSTVNRFRNDGFSLPKVMHASAGAIIEKEEKEREREREKQ